MLWRIDKSLGDEARACRAETVDGAPESSGHFSRGASRIAVGCHGPEVPLLCTSRAIPASTEEAIIQRGSASCCTNSGVGKVYPRTRRLVPGVLSELLQEVGVTRRLLDDIGQRILVPRDAFGRRWFDEGLAGEVSGEVFDTVEDEQPLGVRLGLGEHSRQARQAGQCDQ